MDDLILIVDFVPRSGYETYIKDILVKVGHAIRQEAGCLKFDLLQSLDSTTYTVYEVWESRQLWQAHLTSHHMIKLNEDIKGRLVDMSVQTFCHVPSKLSVDKIRPSG